MNISSSAGYGIRLKISKNVISSGAVGLFLENCYSSSIENNTIQTNDKNGIQLYGCGEVLMHKNLIQGNSGSTKAINLFKGEDYESNKVAYLNKDYPKINLEITRVEPKAPAVGKPFLSVVGWGIPGEVLDLYFSQGPSKETGVPFREDKIYAEGEQNQANALTYAAGNIVVAPNGTWEYKIPRDWYRATKPIYLCVQGTVDGASSSELSNIFTYAPLTEIAYVKNTADDNRNFTLRRALEKVNSTDFYTKVVFNIQDEDAKKVIDGPHTIQITSKPLPVVANYSGFSIDGSTQVKYAYGEGRDTVNIKHTITIKASSEVAQTWGIEVGPDCGDNTRLSHFDLSDFAKGMNLQTGQAKVNEVGFYNTSITGSSIGLQVGAVTNPDVNVVTGEKILFPLKELDQKVLNSTFSNFETALLLAEEVEKIEVLQNKFDNVRIGILVQGANANSIFSKNQFVNVLGSGITLSGRILGTSNINQVIKENTFGYDVESKSYATTMNNAITGQGLQKSFIINNKIWVIKSNGNGKSEDNRGIYITDSKSNLISQNTIGHDLLEAEITSLPNVSDPESEGIIVSSNALEISNDKILSNKIADIGTGIVLTDANAAYVANNTIGGRPKKAVPNTTDTEDPTNAPSGEALGSLEMTQLPLLGQGIRVTGNSINCTVVDNFIGNFNSDKASSSESGISLDGQSSNITMSKNMIFGQSLNEGISIVATSNSAVRSLVPVFNGHTVSGKDLILNLGVTSPEVPAVGSRIEVFTANGEAKQSLRYVGTAVKESDKWTVLVPSQMIDYSGDNRFVATYTKPNVGTSLFSDNYNVSGLLCTQSFPRELFGVTENAQFVICPGEEIVNYIELPKVTVEIKSKDKPTPLEIEKDNRGQKYILKEKGHYVLTAKSSGSLNANDLSETACKIEIEFDVTYKSEPAIPNFIVKEQVYVGDTIAVVDLDYDIAGRTMTWEHEGAIVVENAPNASKKIKNTIEGKGILLSYPNTGYATIKQTSTTPQGCLVTVAKRIQIIPQPGDKKEKGFVGAKEAAIILESVLSPNPVSSEANLILNLRTSAKAPFLVSIFSVIGEKALQTFYIPETEFQPSLNGSSAEEFRFERTIEGWQSLPKGMYYLKIELANDSHTIKFVVQ
jgi:parallel beta-helix repeat protein